MFRCLHYNADPIHVTQWAAPGIVCRGHGAPFLNLHCPKYFLAEAKFYDLAFWHILCKAMLIQTYTFYCTIDGQNSKNKHNITCSAAEELQVRDVKLSFTVTYYRENLCRVNIVWVKSSGGIWTERINQHLRNTWHRDPCSAYSLDVWFSLLTANTYPRLEGIVGYKVLTWAHVVWHAKRNTALRSSISK